MNMGGPAGDRRPWPQAPIGLQLVILLLASLLVAQAISFGMIFLIPPPRPPVYRVADVAAAIRGGPLKTRFGRPIIRTTARSLPPELVAPHREHERTLAGLARTLGAPEARVRLEEQSASPLWRLRRALTGGPPPQRPDRGGPMGGSPFEMDRDLPDDAGDVAPERLRGPWRRFGGGPELPIFGDFSAALQRDDGTWTVVRSKPDAFPSEWQMQASGWLLGGFLLVASAGYLFSRRISAPLRRFAEAAETLGRDPHAPQMTLKGPAEVGAAAHAFNEMQARLKRYINDRTAMVGAISHDLRTPLTRIRFKLEAAPPALKGAVLADVEQMEQMIGGVLAFIRDEGAPRRREKLDLLSLVECVADDAAMVGGQVEIVDGRPVTVDGDPVALQRLFSNLVDNAVKYGGQARIDVLREGDQAVVTIADRGPGLSPDELGRVFQPFYRTDSSRNLDNGGVGLGLPIARSTARAHGGDVELTSKPGGVTAIVTLPVVA
ncbi:HAMP domain-containing sensor histidine kinase [Phenylobacterium sp.]|jgi:signal transduction histidine kinase|uniref:sensor histidine kinase n=1 Tax=Phenylobacterium sp. TaxID=1871053 RepID=UPI002E36534B|nr:HAMP domain-containing sensor histidine kinase [Phenylobacterium sp.]HEX4711978.1 HAMP domain-containing sensor histidine kinase [Phenylobacterium sp.]